MAVTSVATSSCWRTCHTQFMTVMDCLLHVHNVFKSCCGTNIHLDSAAHTLEGMFPTSCTTQCKGVCQWCSSD